MTSLVRNHGAGNQPITGYQIKAGDSNQPITDWDEEEAGVLREPIANWEELAEDLSKSNSKEEIGDSNEPITIWKDEAVNLNQPIVLCHGDCWTNNILFRIDETSGEIFEVCLLDFQVSGIL